MQNAKNASNSVNMNIQHQFLSHPSEIQRELAFTGSGILFGGIPM
jgi:hypothetical protein